MSRIIVSTGFLDPSTPEEGGILDTDPAFTSSEQVLQPSLFPEIDGAENDGIADLPNAAVDSELDGHVSDFRQEYLPHVVHISASESLTRIKQELDQWGDELDAVFGSLQDLLAKADEDTVMETALADNEAILSHAAERVFHYNEISTRLNDSSNEPEGRAPGSRGMLH